MASSWHPTSYAVTVPQRSAGPGADDAWSDETTPIVDGPRVVVVDPDAYGRHAIAHALAGRGLQAIAVKTVPDALAAIWENEASGVVVAERLGTLNGREIIEYLTVSGQQRCFALRVDGEARRAAPVAGALLIGLPWTDGELARFVAGVRGGATSGARAS